MRRDHRLVFECLVCSWWSCWEKTRRYALVGGGVPLRVRFEVSKPLAIPSDLSLCASLLVPWLLSQYVSSQLLLPCHACLPACLPAAVLLTTVVMD